MKQKDQSKPNYKIDEIWIVFIVAIVAIAVSFYDKANNNKMTDAEKITGIILDNHEISILTNGSVNQNKLNNIQNMDYSKLKSYFNVKEEFCMYLEDGNGKILLAKGSSKLADDRIACKE